MIAVLFSGGIDSWACLNWAILEFGKEHVFPFYVDFGQQYAERELRQALELCKRVDVPLIVLRRQNMVSENKADGHIPLRNSLLLMSAAMFDNCEGVVLGMLRGESCEDKNPKYIKLMQKFFDSQFAASIYRKTTREFVIHTPFELLTKAQVIAWTLKHGLLRSTSPSAGIDATTACFSSNDSVNCGVCVSCFNRWVARELNYLPEEYHETNPFLHMVKKIAMAPTERRLNPALFSPKQIWLKRHWLIESYKAMNMYSHHKYDQNLFSFVRSFS